MKIRITGLPAECRAVVGVLNGNIELPLTVDDVSRPYPNRGPDGGVRVYVNLALPPHPTWSGITGCCNECGVRPDEPHGPECRWAR